MISFLRGSILSKRERYLILLIDNKIGYRVYVTGYILEEVSFNQSLALYIYTHVREDALELYGFPTQEGLEFFEQLITISGVGPRSALGVMSIAPLTDIKKAIIHGDPNLLQKVASIGKKTSERIIIELKEKIKVTEKEAASGLSAEENVQLLEALISLGYKESEIKRALQHLPPEAKDLSGRIKEALQILSKGK